MTEGKKKRWIRETDEMFWSWGELFFCPDKLVYCKEDEIIWAFMTYNEETDDWDWLDREDIPPWVFIDEEYKEPQQWGEFSW